MNARGLLPQAILIVINTAVRTGNDASGLHGLFTYTSMSKCVYIGLSVIYTVNTQCSIASINVSYAVCVNKVSVCWMYEYEMTASLSDDTGLPEHAALYITYNTIGCTACLYETFPC
jgi:hypothetical protein